MFADIAVADTRRRTWTSSGLISRPRKWNASVRLHWTPALRPRRRRPRPRPRLRSSSASSSWAPARSGSRRCRRGHSSLPIGSRTAIKSRHPAWTRWAPRRRLSRLGKHCMRAWEDVVHMYPYMCVVRPAAVSISIRICLWYTLCISKPYLHHGSADPATPV